MVFIMKLAADKQKASFKTVLNEADLFVERHCGRVLGIDAKVDLPGAEDCGRVLQGVSQDSSANASASKFRCDVHAPDKCLVRELDQSLALEADQRA